MMGSIRKLALCSALGTVLVVSTGCGSSVVEYPVLYPGGEGAHLKEAGSTHELAFDPTDGTLWVTGQNFDAVVHVDKNGDSTPYSLPDGSGPHGLVFDADARMWVSLEFGGALVHVDEHGNIVKSIDLRQTCLDCLPDGNPGAHGLATGNNGHMLWYTGKAGDTIGRVSPDGTLRSFNLPSRGSKPIYIIEGPDQNMWFTELEGNRIGRITPDGQITEYPIPSPDSRPIALTPDPSGNYLWFTEEVGSKIGRIDLAGNIVEVDIPKPQDNYLLAALTFDTAGYLWVQQYIDLKNPYPTGDDRILQISGSALAELPEAVQADQTSVYPIPTRGSVMHRIRQAPDGNIWFTELATDKVGHAH